MDERRIFTVEPIVTTEQMIAEIPTVHDGQHLELFYNLIFNDLGFSLPDHMRPIAWALADKNIKKLMVIISPGSTKSQLFDIAFPVWEIGLDVNTTILGVSSGADLMIDALQSGMNIIEESKIYRLLFPNVKPDKSTGWSAGRGIYVKRTGYGEANPTFVATGYGAKYITGKHARNLVIDDIHDEDNTSSSDNINKVESFYYRTLLGRQYPTGSRFLMIGRRWAEDDLYGRLKKSGEWLVMTLSNLREDKDLYFDVRIPSKISCVFNNYAPSDKVEDIKVVYGENEQELGFYWKGQVAKYEEALEIKRNKPDIFEIVYQSNPESATTRIFREEDFQRYTIPDSMHRGRNYDEVAYYLQMMKFDWIIQTWDTAFTAKMINDASVGYTLGLKGCVKDHRSTEPNPLELPFHYDVYVLDELYKHLDTGDLQQEIIDYFNIWQPQHLIMENSAAGIPIIQALSSYSIPVIPIVVQHTSKLSRAIDGAKAGSAQGWARQGRMWIPRNAVWATGLMTELKDFTGARNKKDDRVDALIQGTNFAIDLGIQSRDLPPGWREQSDIDARILDWATINHPLLRLPHMYQNVSNPFYGMCGTCKQFDKSKSFCNLHKISVIKIGTCPMYDPSEGSNAIISAEYGQPAKMKNE